MKRIEGIELDESSREEQLPGFEPDFPYIATCAEMSRALDPVVPWRWHGAVELFYMDCGTLEYATPGGTWVFPAGSGGFVNANVLHMSQVKSIRTVQFLHLFDPTFLAGERGSQIEAKYIQPMTSASALEMIALYPDDPEQAAILGEIRRAFDVSEGAWGYEMELRWRLSAIWLKLLERARPLLGDGQEREDDRQVKVMLAYIHEHYPESISVEQLAAAAHVSRRACFRMFQKHLHMSPAAYMRSYRLRKAARMLLEGSESVTQIAYACGLGSSSYFGKVFRERFGCTPAEYRQKWRDKWHDDEREGHAFDIATPGDAL